MIARLRGRGGLGDAIYLRPFARAALAGGRFSRVEIATSWPWIFSDLPVHSVRRDEGQGLALQRFHEKRAAAELWADKQEPALELECRYGWDKLARRTPILVAVEIASGLRIAPVRLDLPELPSSRLDGSYAIVRPPSVRLDYPAPREPEPAYLAVAAQHIRQTLGMRVATLCHWVDGIEEPAGSVPADRRFEHGELDLPDALALVAGASLVVSGPCWLVPACIATGTPMIVLGGGCGARNNPRALVDPRLQATNIRWLLPDSYCMCSSRTHACPRTISKFAERFATLAEAACAAAPAR